MKIKKILLKNKKSLLNLGVFPKLNLFIAPPPLPIRFRKFFQAPKYSNPPSRGLSCKSSKSISSLDPKLCHGPYFCVYILACKF